MLSRFAIIFPVLMLGSQWAVACYGQGTCFGRSVLLRPYDTYYLVAMLTLALAGVACGGISIWKGQPKWPGGVGMILVAASILMPVGSP